MIGSIHPTLNGKGEHGVYKILNHSIEYILNARKTANGLYTNGLNCDTSFALQNMIDTNRFYNKEPKKKSDRIGYHFSISWSPDEKISEEETLTITEEFCQAYLYDYECVIAVHNDKSHMHSHIVFNSVSVKTGYKYRYNNKDWERTMQPILDELCKKRGFHALEEDTGLKLEEYQELRTTSKKKNLGTNNSPKRYKNYYNEKKVQYTKNDYIKHDIDELILTSHSFEMFLDEIRERGYQIKFGNSKRYGEYMSLKPPGSERYRRVHTIGKNYSLDMIKKRIDIKNKPLPIVPYDNTKRYAIPKSMFQLKIYRNKPVFRWWYGKIYTLAVIKKRDKISYQKAKTNLKLIHVLENEINIMLQYDINGVDDARAALKAEVQNMNLVEVKRREIFQNSNLYKEIIKSFGNIEKFEGAYYCYMEGDSDYKNEYEKYMEAKRVIDNFPYTKEEIDELMVNFKQQLKDNKTEMIEYKYRIEALKNIIRSFGENYDLTLNELQLDDIDESINDSVNEKIAKIKRK